MTNTDTPDSAADQPQSGITPEQLAQLKADQKRRMIFAAIAGIILLVLGYFAGQNFRQQRDSEPAGMSVSFVDDVVVAHGAQAAGSDELACGSDELACGSGQSEAGGGEAAVRYRELAVRDNEPA